MPDGARPAMPTSTSPTVTAPRRKWETESSAGTDGARCLTSSNTRRRRRPTEVDTSLLPRCATHVDSSLTWCSVSALAEGARPCSAPGARPCSAPIMRAAPQRTLAPHIHMHGVHIDPAHVSTSTKQGTVLREEVTFQSEGMKSVEMESEPAHVDVSNGGLSTSPMADDPLSLSTASKESQGKEQEESADQGERAGKNGKMAEDVGNYKAPSGYSLATTAVLTLEFSQGAPSPLLNCCSAGLHTRPAHQPHEPHELIIRDPSSSQKDHGQRPDGPPPSPSASPRAMGEGNAVLGVPRRHACAPVYARSPVRMRTHTPSLAVPQHYARHRSAPTLGHSGAHLLSSSPSGPVNAYKAFANGASRSILSSSPSGHANTYKAHVSRAARSSPAMPAMPVDTPKCPAEAPRPTQSSPVPNKTFLKAPDWRGGLTRVHGVVPRHSLTSSSPQRSPPASPSALSMGRSPVVSRVTLARRTGSPEG